MEYVSQLMSGIIYHKPDLPDIININCIDSCFIKSFNGYAADRSVVLNWDIDPYCDSLVKNYTIEYKINGQTSYILYSSINSNIRSTVVSNLNNGISYIFRLNMVRYDNSVSSSYCSISLVPVAGLTPTPTNTVSPSITKTSTPTTTITSTPTKTVTPTATTTVTSTSTPTVSPTNTVTPSLTPTNSLTPSVTPTNTPTNTITPTVTMTVTPSSSVSCPNIIICDGLIDDYLTGGGLIIELQVEKNPLCCCDVQYSLNNNNVWTQFNGQIDCSPSYEYSVNPKCFDATILSSLNTKNNIDPPIYAKPLVDDTIIVMSYFSPCNYKKPRENLLKIVNHLAESNYPVYLIEAVLPNAKRLVLPTAIQHRQIYGSFENIMFLKENLYNIATNDLINNTDYSKFIYLDADIFFDNSNWFNKTSYMLDIYDIIQPFEHCQWLDKHNNMYLRKEGAAKCLVNNSTPDGTKYHPGFSWAMTKKCFIDIDGFYDQHAVGGGDLALWYALDKHQYELISNPKWHKNNNFYKTKTYIKYKNNINNLNLNIGYLNDYSVTHLYHGDRNNRHYNTRYSILPSLHNDEYPLIKNKDGLLTWIDSVNAENCYRYFLSRKEDE